MKKLTPSQPDLVLLPKVTQLLSSETTVATARFEKIGLTYSTIFFLCQCRQSCSPFPLLTDFNAPVIQLPFSPHGFLLLWGLHLQVFFAVVAKAICRSGEKTGDFLRPGLRQIFAPV